MYLEINKKDHNPKIHKCVRCRNELCLFVQDKNDRSDNASFCWAVKNIKNIIYWLPITISVIGDLCLQAGL